MSQTLLRLLADYSFSGIREIDIAILTRLDDKSLIDASTLNRYVASIYRDDELWRKLAIS